MKLGGGNSVGPIAVDLDAHEVRLVQVSSQAARVRVVAAARKALPADVEPDGAARHEAVAKAIRDAASRGGFTGKRLVTSLPATAVHVKNLRLPRMPADELPQAVEWEAKDRLQLDAEPHLIRFFDAGDVRQGEELRREVILLATPTAYAEGHAAALVDQGFKLDAVEAPPAALARLARRTSGGDAPAVMVDVGNRVTTAVIVHAGRVPFCKSINLGGDQMDQAVATHLDLPLDEARRLRRRFDHEANPDADAADAEADPVGDEARRAMYEAVRPTLSDLARETALCLRYFGVTFRGERPGAISLTGPESTSRWLADTMAEAGAVAVGVADPLLPGDDRGKLVDDAGPGVWSVAIGSALRDQRPEPRAKEAA